MAPRLRYWRSGWGALGAFKTPTRSARIIVTETTASLDAVGLIGNSWTGSAVANNKDKSEIIGQG